MRSHVLGKCSVYGAFVYFAANRKAMVEVKGGATRQSVRGEDEGAFRSILAMQ